MDASSSKLCLILNSDSFRYITPAFIPIIPRLSYLGIVQDWILKRSWSNCGKLWYPVYLRFPDRGHESKSASQLVNHGFQLQYNPLFNYFFIYLILHGLMAQVSKISVRTACKTKLFNKMHKFFHLKMEISLLNLILIVFVCYKLVKVELEPITCRERNFQFILQALNLFAFKLELKNGF